MLDNLKICKNGYKALQKMDIEKDFGYMELCNSLSAWEEKLSDKEWDEYRKWVELEKKIQKNEGLF